VKATARNFFTEPSITWQEHPTRRKKAMTKISSVLLVLSGSALGAIATVALLGSARAQVPVPASQNHPQPVADQRQWVPAIVGAHYQYQCESKWEHRYWTDALQAKINERGKQGWRWMGPLTFYANSDVYCFERAY
jgi:hypothetical protein